MNGFDLSKNVVATDFNYPKISLIHIGINISISSNDLFARDFRIQNMLL